MSVSKKLRFEVFKRDGFQCAYCGKTPPEVTLECDHIEPKSKGGSDDLLNLITACFDCNRGKTNIPLDKAPQSLKDNTDVLKEKETQLAEYHKLIRKINRRINKDIELVNQAFQVSFPGLELSERFKKASLTRFLKRLVVEEVISAMHIACERKNECDDAISYFCGICWNKINGKKKS